MNKVEKKITELIMPYLKGEQAFSMNGKGSRCVYNGDNTHCSFAMACSNKAALIEQETAECLLETKLAILLPEYQDMLSNRSWNYVQEIHDAMTANHKNIALNRLDMLSEHGTFDSLREAIKNY